MTTVVAVERKDGSVIFASDTRVTGGHVNDGWIDKVVQNGAITFAAAGYLRTIQVLAYAKFAIPPETRDAEAIDRYVSLELIPAIVDAFDTKDAKAEVLNHSIIILAVRGRVYQVTGDGAWTRSKRGRYSIGSGSAYALGALEAGASPGKAIKIAARYDSGTNNDAQEMEVSGI